MNTVVRTRIAPSPTGDDIHIGNLYTALINFAVAKKNDGQFIIRIEDTDRGRYVQGAEEKILSSLKAFGIQYDEGPDIGGPYTPYRQSERLDLYQKYAQELIQKGAAYYCFCTKERLEDLRQKQIQQKKTPRYDKHCLQNQDNAQERIKNGEAYVIRLNVLPNKTIHFQDLIRGEIKFDSNEVDDQVLIKSDGYPTYHMGVVIDDYLMKITHVIRAEEWISSTPKHVILYESFGWDLPIFAHLPILRNPDKSKLSKRKNPVWASWYLEEGFLPEAMLNYLALLGWSHPEEKEIFTLEEFIRLFDLKDVNPIGPIFDITKLEWMNGVYIRSYTLEDLRSKILEYDPSLESLNDTMLSGFVKIAQTRIKTLKEFGEQIKPFLQGFTGEASSSDQKIKADIKKNLKDIATWDKDSIAKVLLEYIKEESIKFPAVYQAIIGSNKGLPLAEVFEILGKERTLSLLS